MHHRRWERLRIRRANALTNDHTTFLSTTENSVFMLITKTVIRHHKVLNHMPAQLI